MRISVIQSNLYGCSYCVLNDISEDRIRIHEERCLRNPKNLKKLVNDKIIGSTFYNYSKVDQHYLRINGPDIIGEKLTATHIEIVTKKINDVDTAWDFSIKTEHYDTYEVNCLWGSESSYKPCPQSTFFEVLDKVKSVLPKKESGEVKQ